MRRSVLPEAAAGRPGCRGRTRRRRTTTAAGPRANPTDALPPHRRGARFRAVPGSPGGRRSPLRAHDDRMAGPSPHSGVRVADSASLKGRCRVGLILRRRQVGGGRRRDRLPRRGYRRQDARRLRDARVRRAGRRRHEQAACSQCKVLCLNLPLERCNLQIQKAALVCYWGCWLWDTSLGARGWYSTRLWG